MEEEKRIKARWGPVWKRTAGATAVGIVVGAAVARRRLRLALEAGPAAQEIAASTLLAAAASKPPSTIIFTSALAGGLTAGTTTGLFLGRGPAQSSIFSV
jgi:hypothetical protein